MFERTFREFGLPAAIRSDNGTPFASAHALYGLSKLAVWWLRLGIRIERIAPGHPEQNGRHERLHLTLKAAATRPYEGLEELEYPAHDWTAVITACGRICHDRRKINVSQVFAGQKVGVRQTDDHLWLVTFMDYDLGYFDDETCRLEPINHPFGPKLLPMSPE